MTSHFLRVQVLTRTVAKGHNFASRCDSTIVAIADLSGLAFNSCISETRRIISINVSIQSQVCAETGTTTVVHPQSSGWSHCSANCHFTRSTFAPGLSILFIATIIGTPASFAWLILSIVCGFIHSSAAITIIAMSVNFAHLALIILKASCQGVSKKVIFFQFLSTWYAQIFCVIHPASPDATSVFLI